MAESCGASCKAWFESVGFLRRGRLLEKTPAEAGVLLGGSDRRRSGDLSIFSPVGECISADEWDRLHAESQRLDAMADAVEKAGVTLRCQRPVRMIGTNTATGEQVELELRCNTRKARVCPSCAALYRGDISAIMREGIHTAQEQGDKIVFLTMTAPSFGVTHYVPPTPLPRLNARLRANWDKRYRRRCPCGTHHAPGDRQWIGLPVHADTYDYDAQVRWNAAAGRLWSRTADELTRVFDVRNEDGELVRLPYITVAEWQSRGAIHLHVIARIPADLVDGLDPEEDSSRGKGTIRLRRIEHEATAVTTVVDGETIRWGPQCVAEVIESERSMIRTAGYLAKVVGYAVKDLTSEQGSKTPYTSALAAHHARLDEAAAHLRCGERPTSPARSRSEHERHVKWALCEYDQRGSLPSSGMPFKKASKQRRPCRSLRHRQWGWRGHTVRRSRSWSELTITECRRRRRAHHTTEAEERPPWEWSRPVDGPMAVERYDWDRMLEQCAAYRDEAASIRSLLPDRPLL